jgi:membrane-associated protease RseP (regulator of RpoE activity)
MSDQEQETHEPEGPESAATLRRPSYALNLGLFLATCLTTTWAGTLIAHGGSIGCTAFDKLLPAAADGLPYSISILAILLTHEMGHYLVARWHGVNASLPYFIPLPLPLTGTMGAVIVMKGKVPRRNGLVDFAAAGPLAGLIVAIPILIYGIHLSPMGPIGTGTTLMEGNSALYLGLKYLVKGAILPGGGLDVQLHPMAWAGWLGMLVTMLNLMPIGQLDGGHIAAALFGERYERLAGRLHMGLLVLAVIGWGYSLLELSQELPLGLNTVLLALQSGFMWLVWWLILKLFKRFSGGVYHPPVGDDPLTPGRRVLCVGMLVIFALIFAPIPLRNFVVS